ncbi:sphingosine-1-phosphate transporter SPNS2-like isoform X2 [Eriocheir sinensis]|nr:sphingosine-1-phosphate transporter SPNS2-like isoform X2 [Eriocheir sinensis]XP_050708537.1 sphingosine-1-phosphate transporter SPNS2-like isoform X2 [Eriocheir sinensis]XP_050708548.1 sphingosine-1-phosphate transporter SPNS2-like isoform X2 [Eriocheir sinensis]XP_050708557.1 sphingosine-1-phosphate transporter SPNS2-like isoform X2 [Eriocheir sinensis]
MITSSPSSTMGRLLPWVTLGVMSYMYLVGELSHFLLGIVSRPMSQELHYGDIACLPNPEAATQSDECKEFDNKTECLSLLEGDGDLTTTSPNNTVLTTCVWDYSGLGLAYQVLAGPAFVAVFTTAGVIISAIADRFNRKVVVTVCCGVLTFATGMTGAAMTYWQLVILRMLMGAGESSFTPVCSSMISDLFPENLRALALGIFNWGIYLGYGLSYAVGNFVTEADIGGLGWRWSYIITGIMGVVATLLALIIIRDPPRGMQAKKEEEEEEKAGKKDEVIGGGEEGSVEGDVKTSSSSASFPPASSSEALTDRKPGFKEVLRSLLKPPVVCLAFAACLRHTAGFSWAYNTQLYFLTYYPDFNLGLWVTACSIIGGSLGVAVGGFVSDRLVKRLGLRARLYVLAGSQLIATPFAAGVLYFPPPGAFFSLLGAYIFAEMWLGVLFAVLLELVPGKVQSTALAVFLFVMNNVGGNLPVVVDPLTNLLSYRTALLIMYPGCYLASSVVFFLTSFLLREDTPKK